MRILSILALSILLVQPALAADVPGRWTRTGPEGGAVVVLAAAPSRPATVYAGLAAGGGVFRSVDGGASWTAAVSGLGRVAVVRGLAVDAAQPDTVYASTGAGLFKSANGGVSWAAVSLPDSPGGTMTVATDPRRPGVVYTALDGGGIRSSTDRGRTWKILIGPPDTVRVLAIDPVTSTTLYAGTLSSGVYKSTDGGARWKVITRGIHPSVTLVRALAIDPRRPQTIFLATPEDGPYRSVDGGGHWTKVAAGLGDHPDVRSLTVDPATSASVFAGTSPNGVFRSVDGGSTWRPAGVGLPDRSVNTLLATASDLFAGTGTGVAASRDRARTWTVGRGIQGLSISSLEIDSQTPPRIYAFDGARLFKSASRGVNWSRLPLPPDSGAFKTTGPLMIHPSDPQKIEIGRTTAIAQSTDGGHTWTGHFDAPCLVPNRLLVDPNDPEVLYTSGGLAVEVCGLNPWTCASFKFDHGNVSCLHDSSPISRGLPVLAVDPGASSHLFAVNLSQLFHSVDAGATWSVLSSAIQPTGLMFDPADHNILYALLLTNGVARSADGGVTWQVSAAGLPATYVRSLAIDPVHTSTLYAAAGSGAYWSTDSGATWAPLGTGLQEVDVWRIVIDPLDPGILYAATVGGGVMRLQM